jgi:hypothetical protein
VAIEFFLISILQLKAFSAAEYILVNSFSKPSTFTPYTTLEVLLDALNPIDTVIDLIYVVRFIFEHMIMRKPEPRPPSHEVRRLSSIRSSTISLISTVDLGETSRSSE